MRVRARALAAIATVVLAATPLWHTGGAGAEQYVVEEGDALGTIASRLGMSPSRLAALTGSPTRT